MKEEGGRRKADQERTSTRPKSGITGRLARYMVGARERALAPLVAREAKHRIVDTLAAMVSGSHLKPGEMTIRCARAQGGVAAATILTTDIRTSAVNAAGELDDVRELRPFLSREGH